MKQLGIKGKVDLILCRHSEARNSDKVLVELYWKTWDSQHIATNEAGDWVLLANIINMTSPDSITRARRWFQEHGFYEATDPVVRERRARESKVRAAISSGDMTDLPA